MAGTALSRGAAGATVNASRRVVVGGVGVATPLGADGGALLAHLRHGDRRSGPPSERLVPSQALCEAAGARVTDLRKLDRFSLLALAAGRRALREAALTAAEVEQCGMLVGNMMAGWSFTEPQLKTLHESGPAEVSPYLATAWFPAAPQGEVSIRLALRGYSKTVTTDRCAASQAIGLAFRRVASGRSDVLLAGGVEAPVTPLVEAGAAALPGGRRWLAEAAGFLLLCARARGGIRVAGHCSFTLPPAPSSSDIGTRLFRHLEAQPRRPLLAVMCNVPADPDLEAVVTKTVRRALVGDPEVLFPTRGLGDSLAASSAIAAVLAHRLLTETRSPSTVLVLSLGHQCGDLLWLERDVDSDRGMSNDQSTRGE